MMTKFCLKFRIQAGYIALNFLFSHVKAWGGPHVMRLSTLVSPLKPSHLVGPGEARSPVLHRFR